MSAKNDLPMMLYKAPGCHEIHGFLLDYVIVNDDAELETKLAEGWFADTPDAHAAYVREQAAIAEQRAAAANAEAAARGNASAPDSAPATRAELEVKARELGIAFSNKTSDATLSKLIDGKTA